MRFTGLMVVVTVAACGSGSGSKETQGAAGSSAAGGSTPGVGGSAGGTATGGASGGGGGNGAPGPGACAVVRRLEGRTFRSTSILDRPARLPDGFSFLSTAPTVSPRTLAWVLADEENGWHTIDVVPPEPPHLNYGRLLGVTFGSLSDPRLLQFDRMPPVDYRATLLAQSLRADGTAVAPNSPILEVFDRGTSDYAWAVAGDGERAAVGNAHPATWPPRFVLVDKDARPVSAEIRLSDDSLYDCFTLTGTKHGAVGSALDSETGNFHVIEVNAAGQIVSQAVLAVPLGATCPGVSAQDAGVYVSVRSPEGSADGGTTSIRLLASNTVSQVATLPVVQDESYTWIGEGSDPLVAAFHPSSATISFARLKNAHLVPLAGEIPSSTLLLPSADGRVFFWSPTVDNSSLQEIMHTILEVRCGPAAP